MRIFACLLLIACLFVAGDVSAVEPEVPRDSGDSLSLSQEAAEVETGELKSPPRFEFEDALLDEMQRPVHWQLDGETVESLAARVRRELNVPVIVVWQDLEDAGVGREDSITEQFEGPSVEQALETALRRLELVWTLSGKAIVITTREGAEANLETRVYPVSDLLAGSEFKQVDFDSLIDAITATVAVDTWAENGGGDAEIRPFDSSGLRVLIISQTFAVHRRIAQLLHDMREARDAESADPLPALSFDEFRELLVPLGKFEPAASNTADDSIATNRDRFRAAATTEGLRDIARRSNEFSLDLLRRSAIDPSENSVLSGYSVRQALTLIALGASGGSRREIVKALRLPESTREAATESFAMHFHLSSPNGSKGEFSSANSLWLQASLTANSEFVALAEKGMNVSVRSVDFRPPHETATTINEWISQRTGGKLKDVLSPTDIRSDSIAAIVNATCFKGIWETPFDVARTEPGTFMLLDGVGRQVRMMHGKVYSRAALIADSGVQISELPYRGERMSAVILLPSPGRNGLANLEASLTSESLASWLDALDVVDLQLTMPKFKIASRHELKSALAAMGLSKVFDLATADLRRIVDAPLAIDRVVQSAIIEVDERGTEATAATVAGAFGGIKSTPLETMIVDRPFLFLIRDVQSGCLLFVARVTNPAEKG